MKIVISLGGSVLTRNLTPEYFSKLSEAIGKLHDEGHELYIVVGAGHMKKDYIQVVKGLNLHDNHAHNIAIQITHLNANLLRLALGERAYEFLPKSSAEVLSHSMKANATGKIFICGGTEPGQSTDGVAAKIAAHKKADLLINVSNVNGVYTSDPKTDPNAKKLEKLSHGEFLKILKGLDQRPGKFELFDKKAARLLEEKKIRAVMISGADPQELIRAVFGGHEGTEII